jgi:outer membrane murein-binding lipoprotein Lpp
MPDNMTRHFLAALFAVFLAILGITAGCNKSARRDTISATLVAVNAARDGFTAWDLQHQRDILAADTTRAKFEADIAAYREKQDTVRLAFEAVYRLIAAAATQTDKPSLKKAIDAANQLLDDVKALMAPATVTKPKLDPSSIVPTPPGKNPVVSPGGP